jgi:hypothetical protein
MFSINQKLFGQTLCHEVHISKSMPHAVQEANSSTLPDEIEREIYKLDSCYQVLNKKEEERIREREKKKYLDGEIG